MSTERQTTFSLLEVAIFTRAKWSSRIVTVVNITAESILVDQPPKIKH